MIGDGANAYQQEIPVGRLAVMDRHVHNLLPDVDIPHLEQLLSGVQASVRVVLCTREDGLAGKDIAILVPPHYVE